MQNDCNVLPVAYTGRDEAVDLIKGFACLLMVVAHVPFTAAPGLSQATLGSVLFFSSTGMNFFGLVTKREGDEMRIAANAFFLFFAGFANNFAQGTMGQADVFQSAGMALIALLILRRLLPQYWTFLFPLPFLIHLANRDYFYWKSTAGGVSSFFLAPGLFPLLPWLTFYLLGAHLKRFDSRARRLSIGGGALGLVGLLALFTPFDFNKWWMSTDYWLLGVVATALLLEVMRKWQSRVPHLPLTEMRYWGANSLVFYILHSIAIRTLQLWLPNGLLLLALAVTGTAAAMRAALWLQAEMLKTNPAMSLMACGALTLLISWLELFELHNRYARTYAAFGLTVLFLAAHPCWKSITARLRPPTAAGAGPRLATEP